jgi:hypothetical protein
MKKTLFLFIASAFAYFPLSHAQLPGYVPADGIVGWWPFNGNANDESGNGNNGFVDGAILTTDRFGETDKAYNFDGIVKKIIVATNSSFSFENDNRFSISFWIKPASITSYLYNVIFSKQEGSGVSSKGWNVNFNQFFSTFRFRVMNGSDTEACVPNSDITPSTDVFYHVVTVYDNGTAMIYVDGDLVYTEQCSSVIGDNASNFYIGMPNWVYSNTKGFTGTLDDIGIWNRALTEQEIRNLFLAVPSNSVDVEDGAIDFKIYPNPASSFLIIDAGDTLGLAGYSVKIDDVTGRTHLIRPLAQQQTQIELREWAAAGVYLVSILDKQGKAVIVKKVAVQ